MSQSKDSDKQVASSAHQVCWTVFEFSRVTRVYPLLMHTVHNVLYRLVALLLNFALHIDSVNLIFRVLAEIYGLY